MAYIGKSPTTGKFQKLDDISSGFNDSTTTFAVQSNGTNVQIDNAQQLLVSIDGVLQEPQSAYTTSASGITFTEAPNTNATFFAILLGETGTAAQISPIDNSVSTAKIQANAVTHVKLAADAVGTPQIKNGEVTQAKLTTGTFPVNAANIAADAVTTAKLAADAVTTAKLGSNLTLNGKTIFAAAVQEKANVLTSNILGIEDGQGRSIINIDPLFNSVLYYTGNSQSGSHTVNFINMGATTKVGNTTSFVVSLTNNVNSFANISNVRIDGNEARGHENPTTSNCLFVSGGPIAAGSGLGGDTEANINIYTFNVTCVSKDPDAYSVFVTKTNFT